MRITLTPSDLISIARVPLALLFAALFRRQQGPLLTASIVIAVVAQASDHLDGHLARRAGNVTVSGWLFDSVPDRAFYIAAVIAFDREYDLGWFLVWSFTFREICLYAFRVGVGDFDQLVPGFRKLVLVHAGLVRFGIACGCLVPYGILPFFLNSASLIWVVPIVATVFGYWCLYVLARAMK